MMSINLKNQLKFYLNRNQITSAELSRCTGVSKQILSDWASGAMPKNLENVRKVAVFFNTTIDNLVFGEGANLAINKEKSIDMSNLISDDWISGKFEIKIRRIKDND